MKKEFSYSVLIPLRGGSKSIPKKNIKALLNQPLAFWVINSAIKSRNIDNIYVSTDCTEIKETIQSQYGCTIKIIDRPSELATDEATTEEVIFHALNYIDSNVLITIQATSPLLTTQHLDEAIYLFEQKGYDSLLTATRCKRFFWTDNFEPINYCPGKRPRRQDFLGTLMENGAFYITKRTILETLHCRLGGHIGIYEMEEKYSIEIDEPQDWQNIEKILANEIILGDKK